MKTLIIAFVLAIASVFSLNVAHASEPKSISSKSYVKMNKAVKELRSMRDRNIIAVYKMINNATNDGYINRQEYKEIMEQVALNRSVIESKNIYYGAPQRHSLVGQENKISLLQVSGIQTKQDISKLQSRI